MENGLRRLLRETEVTEVTARGPAPGSAPGLTSHPSAGGAFIARIAVRSVNRIVIVPVATIIRLEAEDNYVRLWAERAWLHKETLSGLMTRLDPACFARVHRSHAVSVQAVRELKPQPHGEYEIVLADGTTVTSGRSYRAQVQDAFGLG